MSDYMKHMVGLCSEAIHQYLDKAEVEKLKEIYGDAFSKDEYEKLMEEPEIIDTGYEMTFDD